MNQNNFYTLQVRIGKCKLSVLIDSYFAVSLLMNDTLSLMSPVKKVQNRSLSFNTTLRINIQKQVIQQTANPKCQILLYLIEENREKQIYGSITIDILQFNNQGFSYHKFNSCPDGQAEIQFSLSYGNSFVLEVASEIENFYLRQTPAKRENPRKQSGQIEAHSVVDSSESEELKNSKCLSHIYPISMIQSSMNFSRVKPQRGSSSKKLIILKPDNLDLLASKEIISLYQTQINLYESELKQRDNWANCIKLLIQQLEAENQLLKQMIIQELQENNVKNVEQAIDFVSKFVHEEFQTSRSFIRQIPREEKQIIQTSQEKPSQKQSLQSKSLESNRLLTHTKSYKVLPQTSDEAKEENSSKKLKQSKSVVIQNQEDVEKALQILKGNQTENIKISELEEQLFKLRQKKQQLYDKTEQLQIESNKMQLQRNIHLSIIENLQLQIQKINQYLRQVKIENTKLTLENQKLEKNIRNEELEKLLDQNDNLRDKSKELERQMKESLKAIEQFKNDALSARQELIMKEEELNGYKLQIGQFGSRNNGFGVNSLTSKNETDSYQLKNCQTQSNSINAIPGQCWNLLYSTLLQTSINQRRELHHSLSQIIASRSVQNSRKYMQLTLKRLQLKINKMFVGLFKNKAVLKNLLELEMIKVQIGKEIQILASFE